MICKNRGQNYLFFACRPNKMHKNSPIVHKTNDLCKFANAYFIRCKMADDRRFISLPSAVAKAIKTREMSDCHL